MHPDEVNKMFASKAAWVHGGYARVRCEGCGDQFDADSVIVDWRVHDGVWCSMGCWLKTWSEPREKTEQGSLL